MMMIKMIMMMVMMMMTLMMMIIVIIRIVIIIIIIMIALKGVIWRNSLRRELSPTPSSNGRAQQCANRATRSVPRGTK